MINKDFSSLQKYRSDGRTSLQIRDTYIELGVKPNVDGSCLLKQVNGPYQRSNPSDDLLKIQYVVAPFSSLQKRKSKYDREFSVFTENVRKSFQSIIVDTTLAKSQINVLVTVLQNQGSAKSAVMNSISLALANAGIGVKDFLVSCTLGYLYSEPIIDPNQQEQFDLQNQIFISYSRRHQQIDHINLQSAKTNEKQFKDLLQMALNSCRQMYKRLRKALVEHSQKKMLIF